MAPRNTTALIKLSDSNRIIADPVEDIRGRQVHDSGGDDLGRIDDLLIDDEEGTVRFLLVGHGGILGFGATHSFIPVNAVTGVTDEAVHIAESRERVASAPRYNPDLPDGSQYFSELYGYYGYVPYGIAGRLYPDLPRRPK